ncbi:ricin-type beta-trefoil lectin domain protein [Pacificoceanicola onchidii]|uniref:ricin-type beta-trefoil lectin domain protein n=1 Tax=Pacificoceanicola onchidii TaxID=2562685 RepID=UPI0014562452|nr:ricin-type beta-trefoil lectin domain protein [Pacificoceanicola onchidii]
MSPMKSLPTALCIVALSSPALAENVEIYLVDMLDNIQNGYCIDIAKGRGEAANPDDGLQAHTCYSPSGEVLVDQAFDPDLFAQGVLFMPEFDVCMQALSTETGALADLAACDGSAAQSWVFGGEGTIAPSSAPEMCLTVTGETRTGRSDQNQMIAMTLQACSDELAAFQTWSNRTAD